MQLSDNYRIVVDENNVVLQFFETREKKKKDGGVESFEYQNNTYHSTIKQALKAFLQKNIRESGSVQDCLNRINEVENKIDQLQIPINHEG